MKLTHKVAEITPRPAYGRDPLAPRRGSPAFLLRPVKPSLASQSAERPVLKVRIETDLLSSFLEMSTSGASLGEIQSGRMD
jgi:hypothetical protein